MRLINAFIIKRFNIDGISGILDWLLSPYYVKQAYPTATLVLYTNKQSVAILGELWEFIKNSYDEVHVDLMQDNKEIFSNPKFEAISKEIWNHGTDFIMLDNDLYIFPGFLENIKSDYCVYYSEPHLVWWYHSIINNEYDKLNAPSWFTWNIVPFNCATIRLNNKEFLLEYLQLYYNLRAENLTEARGHKAMIKEQWSLAELLNKYKIKPQCLFNKKYSFHKGCIKDSLKPSKLIQIQEYLLNKLFPNIYIIFNKKFNHDEFFESKLEDETCLDALDEEYKINLLKPLYKNKKL